MINEKSLTPVTRREARKADLLGCEITSNFTCTATVLQARRLHRRRRLMHVLAWAIAYLADGEEAQ